MTPFGNEQENNATQQATNNPRIPPTIDGEVVEPATSPIAPNSQIATANSQNTARVIIIKPKNIKPKYSPAEASIILKEFKLSNLSVDDYCRQINTPSPATLRKWLKMEEKKCPHCQEMKMKIIELEATVRAYEKKLSVTA